MKTILLAGGPGPLNAEGVAGTPKSLIEVGGRAILARIMDIYSRFGHQDFIVAAGFKPLVIKQYFANYSLIANDITVALDSGQMTLRPASPGGWNVSVVDTGRETNSSGCVRRLKDWLGGGTFMATYGNGLANIDIDALLAFHRSHGKLATMTAVRPHVQAGVIKFKGDRVEALHDKVQNAETWVNGGYFVFEPDVLDYLIDDAATLDQGPLPQIARDGELMAYRHPGFWHPLETLRDRKSLDKLAAADTPPWLDFDTPKQSLAQRNGTHSMPQLGTV
ncbi:MAG: sugar phosphate nucleotidyltransferase [Pseudomonadota bacterium]